MFTIEMTVVCWFVASAVQIRLNADKLESICCLEDILKIIFAEDEAHYEKGS